MEDCADILAAELPGLLRSVRVPGVSLALVRDAVVARVGASGLADSRSEQPLTTATVFQAASLGKPLFAYAVLGLVERGALDLDVPLTEYLPEPYVPDDPLLSAIMARLNGRQRYPCYQTAQYAPTQASPEQSTQFIQ